MFRKAILATGGLLALILPEMFREFFDTLRQSDYFWLYQLATLGWTCVFVLALLPWSKLRRRRAVHVEARIQPGLARMGTFGMLQKPTADMIVTGDGGPFILVARAKLTAVSPPGLPWAPTDEWEYRPRTVKGGVSSPEYFHMATVQTDVQTGDWVVCVRGEDMVHVRRWQGRGPMWFDLDWTFLEESESTRQIIKTIGVRILLSQDEKSFVMNVRP